MATTRLKMNSDWKQHYYRFFRTPCPSYFTDLAYKCEHFSAEKPVVFQQHFRFVWATKILNVIYLCTFSEYFSIMMHNKFYPIILLNNVL